jgi:hypothetical protein
MPYHTDTFQTLYKLASAFCHGKYYVTRRKAKHKDIARFLIFRSDIEDVLPLVEGLGDREWADIQHCLEDRVVDSPNIANRIKDRIYLFDIVRGFRD